MLQAIKRLFSSVPAAISKEPGASRSKSLAKSRLSFVLAQDRTGLTNEEMSKFRRELVAVIEKYFEIDESAFDIAYKRETDSTTLLINSPVNVKRLSPRAKRAAENRSDTQKAKSESAEVSQDAPEAQAAP